MLPCVSLFFCQASLSDESEESDELPEDEESAVDASPLRRDSSGLQSHGRASTASLRFERQPLANDAEGEGDPHLVPPPPPRRVSLWGSIRTSPSTLLLAQVPDGLCTGGSGFGAKSVSVELACRLLLCQAESVCGINSGTPAGERRTFAGSPLIAGLLCRRYICSGSAGLVCCSH